MGKEIHNPEQELEAIEKVKYRDSRFSATLKKISLGIVDNALFFVANLAIAMTDTKAFIVTTYTELAFSYLHFIVMAALVVAIHYSFGLYRSVWSFAGSDEFVRGVAAATVDMGMLMLMDRLVFEQLLHYNAHIAFWRYIFGIVIDAAFIVGIRFGYRILRRAVAFSNVDRSTEHPRVMIVGAGFMGNFVIETLRNDAYKDGKPIIALDDNPSKYKKVINGVKVVGSCSKIPEMVRKYKIDTVILSLPSAPQKKQKELILLILLSLRMKKRKPWQKP